MLKTLPDNSINCCVTSPPYFGLRNYGGMDGQIGIERQYPEYIARLVDVFREVRRALRSDGTLWLNLGDSYATGAGSARIAGGDAFGKSNGIVESGDFPASQANRMPQPGLKPKDLMMIPARVAIALQDDGWYLRSDIVWHKPNPMPESVTDRPTKAHEYLFLLSKSPKYYYNAEAIAEASITNDTRRPYGSAGAWELDGRPDKQKHGGEQRNGGGQTRNKRSVWTITTEAYAGAHFATMPTALIEPCILAGCPEGGTVADPFTGSGTVGVVALRHSRNFVGIELNPEYVEMARNRIQEDLPMFNEEAGRIGPWERVQ